MTAYKLNDESDPLSRAKTLLTRPLSTPTVGMTVSLLLIRLQDNFGSDQCNDGQVSRDLCRPVQHETVHWVSIQYVRHMLLLPFSYCYRHKLGIHVI